MDSGIYLIHNNITDKYYIGKGSNVKERWRHHKYVLQNKKHHNKDIQEDFDKYGIESFDFRVIEYCENLDEREIYWISYYSSRNLYNKTTGGDSGYTVNPISIERSKKANNLLKSSVGQNNGSSKLTDSEVYDIKIRFINGESKLSIEKDYPHIKKSTLYAIKNGTSWKHILPEYNEYLYNKERIEQNKIYQEAIDMYNQGISMNKIAKHLHISRGTVSKLVHQDNTEVNG